MARVTNAVLEERLENMNRTMTEGFKSINANLESKVPYSEFIPIRRFVYGLIGMAGGAIFTVLVIRGGAIP